MIPLEELVRLLSRDAPLDSLDGVHVIRDSETGLPHLVAIDPDASLTIEELTRVFGEPRRGRTHPDQPREYIFDTQSNVKVIAKGIEGRVVGLKLRRDRA